MTTRPARSYFSSVAINRAGHNVRLYARVDSGANWSYMAVAFRFD